MSHPAQLVRISLIPLGAVAIFSQSVAAIQYVVGTNWPMAAIMAAGACGSTYLLIAGHRQLRRLDQIADAAGPIVAALKSNGDRVVITYQRDGDIVHGRTEVFTSQQEER